MGRELKRVPLDFDWPLDEPWTGYLNPHHSKLNQCGACNGRGQTIAAQRLGDLVSLLMLSCQDTTRGECHPYFYATNISATRGKACGKDMVELTSGLAGRQPSFLGHDGSDRFRAERKIIAAAGLPADWGTCLVCNGSGEIWESEEARQAAENWTREEPPAGLGFQIWETVSEGSPISPVFATAEELAHYMAGRSWGADDGSSYESWLKFINGPGWAPSMTISIGDTVKISCEPDAAD